MNPEDLYEKFVAEIILRFPSRCSISRESTLSGVSFSWLLIHDPSRALPPCGWKIHVSCSVPEISQLLTQVVSPLLSRGHSFKLPRRLQDWYVLNSGAGGHTQVGKIVTIYPTSDEETRCLALFLRTAWPSCEGPRVLSDLPLNETGSISVRFGAFGKANLLIDEEGRTQYEIRLPGNIRFIDKRSLSGDQGKWAPSPPVGVSQPRFLSLPTIVNLGGKQYLLYGYRHYSPKSILADAVDIESENHIVVKIVARGVAEDASGSDGRSRLKQEFDCLSALDGNVQWTARPLGFMQDDEQALLALTQVEGQPIPTLAYDARLRAWNKLVDAVEQLHQIGFVHRDIKLDNVLSTAKNQVSIVDFEFCKPIGSHVPGGAGTRGHRSPIATDVVSVQEDEYALIASLFHAATDCTPAAIPLPSRRMIGLAELCTTRHISRVIRAKLEQHYANVPSSVPSFREVLPERELRDYQTNLLPTHNCLTRKEKQWFFRAIAETVDATYEVRNEVSNGCYWPSGFSTGHSEFQALNHGAAGILLALLTISKACPSRKAEDMISGSSEWLRNAPIYQQSAGLFSGNAGIALALCKASERLGNKRLATAGLERLRTAVACVGHHELFFGAAGVLLAAVKISSIYSSEEPIELAKPLAERLRAAAYTEGDVVFWPSVRDEANMGPLFGAAHGTAGTALGLAIFGELSGDVRLVQFARDAARSVYLFSRSKGLRYIPMGMNSVGVRRRSNEWCHGTGGYLWCLLQMPGALTHDEMRDLLDEFIDSPVMASPILCHGLAGQLDICRLALNFGYRTDYFRERIVRLLRMLRLMAQRRSGKIVWGGENPEHLGPGLLTGWLGPSVEIHLALHDDRSTLL